MKFKKEGKLRVNFIPSQSIGKIIEGKPDHLGRIVGGWGRAEKGVLKMETSPW